MVEKKLYKTKLCMLYQRGRCSRQFCNFAHGSAELRRSFDGRQEYREGRDLRERLDRMRSPLHKSPGRGDAKVRHSSHGDSPRSIGKRIDRNNRKRKHLDGHSDYSGRMSDGTLSDTRIRIDEQLREMQSEMKMLESDKRQLEIYVEDMEKEADTLTLKLQELEKQLSKEKEECKRNNVNISSHKSQQFSMNLFLYMMMLNPLGYLGVRHLFFSRPLFTFSIWSTLFSRFTNKIKKFIKAHNRHLQLQDELKRSQAQLQKLGEQLDLDTAGPGNEDDSKMNTTSDDVTGGYAVSPLNEGQMNSSPQRKRSRVVQEAYDASNQVNPVGGRTEIGKNRVEKFSRQSGNHDQLSNSRKPDTGGDAYSEHGSLTYEDKSKRGINLPADISSADKYKACETGPPLPSTGIAAHAMDEDVEVVETDDKSQRVGASSTGAETETSFKTSRLPFLPPPPPPIPQNVYSQYKGDDEKVDIDGVDEDTVEVDIV
ncbi:hypothetical protein CDL12_08989 [Handroanthus impetiginosus]|uniref:C3H1-type domain-containing protein n=1 Tax=Handroanthus impetiginosus TaxID=429701 RepID=A0A2G9HLC7_9LAMI|nr:hypothetical protein CDL12_08989 [Handroanthus impetiginosus]